MRFIRLYSRVLRMLRQDRWLAFALVGGNVLVAGLQFIDPILFGHVVGLLAGSDKLAHSELWSDAITLIGVWLGVGIVGIIANLLTALNAERLAHRNRLRVMSTYFEHVLTLPSSFHGESHSGKLMKTMQGGAQAMFAVWLTFFRDQMSTYVTVVALLPVTLLLNWRLAIALVFVVVVFLVVTTIVIHRTQAGQSRAEQAQSALAATAQDALANVTVVQAFTRHEAETRRFGRIVGDVIAHQFPVLNWWAAVNVLTRAASTMAVISIVVIGTLLHIAGKASIPQIVAFMGFAGLLVGKLEGAVTFTSRLFQQAAGMEQFLEVLDARTSLPERSDAAELAVPQGEVSFEDVSFAYPGGPNILDRVSFIAKPGSKIALVGPTGAGKTTSMNLLQRLWDPTGGGVLVDGQDIRDVTLESLHRSIGVVFQENLLFNRPIRDNLMVGKPDATQEEIERACRLADAHEFIMRQPQGYDTLVGERGSTLSGGQRQRLAIARALLKNPPILILDEATSALDAATEAKVTKAMGRLMQGRTTFIIAHRLSTVRDADEILMFEGGRIVERGDFEALIRHNGRFAALVASQVSGTSDLRAAE